jgi:hypothetical protein
MPSEEPAPDESTVTQVTLKGKSFALILKTDGAQSTHSIAQSSMTATTRC